MIHDHDEFVHVKSPAAWGHPPFHLGERVYAQTTDNPGTITGMMFIADPIEINGEQASDRGWWFEIELDKTARFYSVSPREVLSWDVIQPFRVSSQPEYELAVLV